ncbi:MAG: DUF4037 domain-containing protein [Eubacterium sp.]|nr:DUF4037 domain-containing protein [Eubacterium sp.]
MKKAFEDSRRFYNDHVAPMIRESFPEYESRIAVGIAGEGSDCFGYDDLMSRDHDYGTGVCLWLTDEDYAGIGHDLSDKYNALIKAEGITLTARLTERRGVMTIHDFYSNNLNIDCDTNGVYLTQNEWLSLDHNCLATAVNGEVFRDDLGNFTAFRNYLLDYYPDRAWKYRIVNELHTFSAALQVNYARCMTRNDIVAAKLCQSKGLEAAMQLFFLMKRVYPPYYKWTYRRLTEIDEDGRFAQLIRELADLKADPEAWTDTSYSPVSINMNDRVIFISEQIAFMIANMMKELGLIKINDPYLERYVDEILNGLR